METCSLNYLSDDKKIITILPFQGKAAPLFPTKKPALLVAQALNLGYLLH